MPGIVDFPTVVEEAVSEFGGLFANAPERRHFAEYLTGLMVAERKNVSTINAEFLETTDQSCLNRWITQVRWDGKWLNEHRLQWLQDRTLRRAIQARGVIAIDHTPWSATAEKRSRTWAGFGITPTTAIGLPTTTSSPTTCAPRGNTIRWNSVAFASAGKGTRTRPSGAIPSCSKSWWIGSFSDRSRGNSPSTATSAVSSVSVTSIVMSAAT